MAQYFKLTAHLNHKLGGVSESYYLNTNDRATAINQARLYCAYRALILASEVAIVNVSLTQTGKPPNSVCLPLNFPINRPISLLTPIAQLPGAGSASDIVDGGDNYEPDGVNTVQAGMHIRFTSLSGHNAIRILRFIPDAYVNNARFVFAITGRDIMQGTSQLPRTGDPTIACTNFIIWVLNNTGNTTRPFNPRKITGVSNAIGATIQTATAHGVHVGDVVNIRGVFGASDINGGWEVVSIVNTTKFTVNNTVAPGVYVTGGTISADPAELTQEAWAHACVVRPTTKKVGRPFAPFRGRRRFPK